MFQKYDFESYCGGDAGAFPSTINGSIPATTGWINRCRILADKNKCRAAVFGCYTSLTGSATLVHVMLQKVSSYGANCVQYDFRALTTSAEQVDIINVNILPTNSIANWRGIYETINYCNTVIDFAPGVLAKTPRLRARAGIRQVPFRSKALRALVYFYLVRTMKCPWN